MPANVHDVNMHANFGFWSDEGLNFGLRRHCKTLALPYECVIILRLRRVLLSVRTDLRIIIIIINMHFFLHYNCPTKIIKIKTCGHKNTVNEEE